MRPLSHLEHAWRIWVASTTPWLARSENGFEPAVRTGMMRRNEDHESAGVTPADDPAIAVAPVEAGRPERRNWLARLLDRLEASAWERETKARDAYFAEATSNADLEQRIRDYDRAAARRGRDRFFDYGH